jgi:hypothetical protein
MQTQLGGQPDEAAAIKRALTGVSISRKDGRIVVRRNGMAIRLTPATKKIEVGKGADMLASAVMAILPGYSA